MFLKEDIATSTVPPMCHSASITMLDESNIFAVWYACSYEGSQDSCLMFAKRDSKGWQTPNELYSIPGLPLGNPVVFNHGGIIHLFFCILYGNWWTESRLAHCISTDSGTTWSKPTLLDLPSGMMTRTKPIVLSNNAVLLPIYDEKAWAPHVLVSEDNCKSWHLYGDTTARGKAIQPTLAELPDGSILMLTRSNTGKVLESRSKNMGKSWIASQPTSLPNPNSSIDMVKIEDKLVLALNPQTSGRTVLAVAMSCDWGQSWRYAVVDEDNTGELSYPSLIVDKHNKLHLAYTSNRSKISYITFDSSWLEENCVHDL
jgi:predicted neuraminidase